MLSELSIPAAPMQAQVYVLYHELDPNLPGDLIVGSR
jgi:hypothetical protein